MLLANQRTKYREAIYQQPQWQQVIEILINGKPTSLSDLYALTIDHLREYKNLIPHENINTYKDFLNLDGYERPKGPRPETACRNTIVQHLRQRLQHFGINVEPEQPIVRKRSVDFTVSYGQWKVVVEVKLDFNTEVWEAPVTQLESYAKDPGAKGYGVYLVLWFGKNRGKNKRICKPPNNYKKPQSAAQMEQILNSIISDKKKNSLTAIVIDVSG